MGHRLQITISNQMYVFLNALADDMSVSIAELCRRSFDTTWGKRGEKLRVELTLEPGRRSGRRIP